MRLLNSRTLQLKEFYDTDLPAYAILSHRWQDDEVSFADMLSGLAPSRAGYGKLVSCSAQAVRDGLDYVWVDAFCIDKGSSAELSESINSMYRWYQNSRVCYAFLFDVPAGEGVESESFEKSVWWTRGWTLQELLAPSSVVFYNAAWEPLGEKVKLSEAISTITEIDVSMLRGADPEEFSVAKRMSWASRRTTTRVEDVAYSLLGLFNVYMPMLYGEGARSFQRLQEEIMMHSDDQSLFAWKSEHAHCGLLAESPAVFQGCSNIVPLRAEEHQAPFWMTNMGLCIELPMVPWTMDTQLAGLECEVENVPDSRIGLFLKLLPEKSPWFHVRVLVDGQDRGVLTEDLALESERIVIYVHQKYHGKTPWSSYSPTPRMYGFWFETFDLKTIELAGTSHRLYKVQSWNTWCPTERALRIPTGIFGTAGVFWWDSGDALHGLSSIKLGFDRWWNPVCELAGPLWSADPGKNPVHEIDEDARVDPEKRVQLHSRWVGGKAGWLRERSVEEGDRLCKGDRLDGMDWSQGRFRITIEYKAICGEDRWVVGIIRRRSFFDSWQGRKQSLLVTTK